MCATSPTSTSWTTPTAQKYVGILERLFLTRQVPPWSSNAVSRLTKTPKLHFLDTCLLAALRDVTAAQLQKDRTAYGPLLENFVVSEVRKLTTWSGKRLRISHFRTKEQDEVDLVLHDHDRITPFDERLHAAPVSLLWQATQPSAEPV